MEIDGVPVDRGYDSGSKALGLDSTAGSVL